MVEVLPAVGQSVDSQIVKKKSSPVQDFSLGVYGHLTPVRARARQLHPPP
jgi:hypothetical protein